MIFKGLLVDLDGTFYNYEIAHEAGLKRTIQYFCDTISSINHKEANVLYEQAKRRVHLSLMGTASSHNRLLYFQQMIELKGIRNCFLALEMESMYWTEFLNNMKVFDEVIQYLKFLKDNRVATCLVTDLTSQIQYQKIKKLEIEEFIDFIVSSEEVGCEKPHPHIFMTALDKLGLKSHEVMMMGDSYAKDLIGANNLNIPCIWLNLDEEIKNVGDTNFEIKNLSQLKEFYNE